MNIHQELEYIAIRLIGVVEVPPFPSDWKVVTRGTGWVVELGNDAFKMDGVHIDPEDNIRLMFVVGTRGSRSVIGISFHVVDWTGKDIDDLLKWRDIVRDIVGSKYKERDNTEDGDVVFRVILQDVPYAEIATFAVSEYKRVVEELKRRT